MSPTHRWRRADGTVLSCADLTQAVPMILDELHDIVYRIDLVEEWLRLDADAQDLLGDWLLARTSCPDPVAATWTLIEDLGTQSVKLHRLIRAGIPDTGHVHPPTG